MIFAYLARLLTLIDPCVLPVLPIVLVSPLQADRRGPIALAAGMSLAFVSFGMLVATFGHSSGLHSETLSPIGASIVIVFGVVLLVPAWGTGSRPPWPGLQLPPMRRSKLGRMRVSAGSFWAVRFWGPFRALVLGRPWAVRLPWPRLVVSDRGVLCAWRIQPDPWPQHGRAFGHSQTRSGAARIGAKVETHPSWEPSLSVLA